MTKETIRSVLEQIEGEGDVDLDDFTERLYVMEKIERGRRQIDEGLGIPHEESKKRLAKWL